MTIDGDNLDRLAAKVFEENKERGFWEDISNPLKKAEKIALIHSEVSELLEGVRKPGPDEHCPEFTKEEIELSDALIRILDYAGAYGVRLQAATRAKLAYNRTRPWRHGKRF